jgi:D-alanyl-D-alanine dipeptidase
VVRALLIVIALGGAAAADGQARQPREPKQHDDDLVDVAGVIADAVIDMRYATADNSPDSANSAVGRTALGSRRHPIAMSPP